MEKLLSRKLAVVVAFILLGASIIFAQVMPPGEVLGVIANVVMAYLGGQSLADAAKAAMPLIDKLKGSDLKE